ncbi:MAG TPA: hypothetical protein VJ553_02355, partial [Candidatus Paceibacterota bacterium]|nr:hypothetical protein [Candidatus Paceibacterota bacterium]
MTTTVWDEMLSLQPLLFEYVLAPEHTYQLGPYVYEIPRDITEDVVNTARAYAYDVQRHERWANASWTIDVVHPDVVIEKIADIPCAGVGENITFTITVTNPGTADVWLNGTITDPMLNKVWEFANLTVGDSESYNVTIPMPADMDTFTNIAWVVAYDHQMHEVRDEASVTVDIVHPDVVLEKRANKTCAAVNEVVTYTIIVTNPDTADVPISGTVYDYALGWSASFSDLVPGADESWDIDFAMPDVPLDVSEFWNDAYVRAEDAQGHVVEDWASVRVDVVHPDVEITKTASLACAAVNENVTFTITVTNPAGCDVWLNGTVFDVMLGKVWTFTNLTPGNSVKFSAKVPMPAGMDEFLNTASVEAYDHQRHLVTGNASVLVDIVHPMVVVEKVADRNCAAVGEMVNYTITVTNPDEADVWLNGTVRDEALDWERSFTNLTPGQSLFWTVQMLMPDPQESVFWNMAEVYATDHQNHSAYDFDEVMV